jgi:hypothetical protein
MTLVLLGASPRWSVTDQHLFFSNYGNIVAGAITVLVCVNTSTALGAKKFDFLTPPQVAPAPLAVYL